MKYQMREQLIRVDTNFIAHGEKCNCNSCPVALAINDAIPAQLGIHCQVEGFQKEFLGNVIGCKAYFCNRESEKIIETIVLPNEVAEKIFDYDYEGKMQPFEFMLFIPTEA